MGMSRTDYVGVGVALKWDDIKDVVNGNDYARHDELVNYDIATKRPAILGAGEDTVVAMIPFFEPARIHDDGFLEPMELDMDEIDILIMGDCVRDWCFHNFGIDITPRPLIFSVWR